MEKGKSYPSLDVEGVRFTAKVVYNTDTMHIGVWVIQADVEKRSAQRKEYYKNNKEVCKERTRVWQDANPKKVKAMNEEWNQANIEYKAMTAKRYYKDHKDVIDAQHKRYYENNKDRCAATIKRWCQANPDKTMEYRRERRTYLSAYKDCKKLNQWFPCCAAHHVEPDVMMHIPEQMHNAVYHNMKTGRVWKR